MFDCDALFSDAFKELKGNIIRELYKKTSAPGFISFAGGNPSPDTFPNLELAEISAEVLRKNGTQCLQYGVSNGQLPLREYVAEAMTAEGVKATVDNVIITTGSQQSLELVTKALINPGDRVLVENPTYVAALKIFGLYQADIVPIASDEKGIIPEDLEKRLREGPTKLIYLIPNFQNPTGITLSRERREKIMEIVKDHNVVVIEDDPYGKLRYDGEALPHMKTRDDLEQVVYLGSFSKIIAPGLRVAYVVCDEKIAQKIVLGKQNSDMHTPGHTQMIVNEYCRRGLLEPHIRECCALYAGKRDLMLEAIEKHFPQEMKWIRPQGGLFLWATLPDGGSAMDLLDYALPAKVAYVPGDSFFADGSGIGTMRFNFANASDDNIRMGIHLLGERIADYLSDGSPK